MLRVRIFVAAISVIELFNRPPVFSRKIAQRLTSGLKQSLRIWFLD
jgi:hypothetical protein